MNRNIDILKKRVPRLISYHVSRIAYRVSVQQYTSPRKPPNDAALPPPAKSVAAAACCRA